MFAVRTKGTATSYRKCTGYPDPRRRKDHSYHCKKLPWPHPDSILLIISRLYHQSNLPSNVTTIPYLLMQHQWASPGRQFLNILRRILTSGPMGITQHGQPVLAEEEHNCNKTSTEHRMDLVNEEHEKIWNWKLLLLLSMPIAQLPILKCILISNLLFIYTMIRWIKCPVLSMVTTEEIMGFRVKPTRSFIDSCCQA